MKLADKDRYIDGSIDRRIDIHTLSVIQLQLVGYYCCWQSLRLHYYYYYYCKLLFMYSSLRSRYTGVLFRSRYRYTLHVGCCMQLLRVTNYRLNIHREYPILCVDNYREAAPRRSFSRSALPLPFPLSLQFNYYIQNFISS